VTLKVPALVTAALEILLAETLSVPVAELVSVVAGAAEGAGGVVVEGAVVGEGGAAGGEEVAARPRDGAVIGTGRRR